jgi:UDP-glucose 6-dehydrogenase
MIGAGYVGLVSGACIADFGHQVVCVDKDVTKVGALQRGEIPIFEPGLHDVVRSNVEAGRLSFSTEVEEPVRGAEAVFIAVGTPSRRGDGHADLSYVFEAAREIASALKDFTVVITKSTVPVGTGDEVERIIREVRPDADFAVVSNPELGARIRVFDPVGMGQAQALLTDVVYCKDAYDCAEAADALVIATEWEQFRALDLERVRDLMACPVIVDLHNIYPPEQVYRHGFAYGRQLVLLGDNSDLHRSGLANSRPSAC